MGTDWKMEINRELIRKSKITLKFYVRKALRIPKLSSSVSQHERLLTSNLFESMENPLKNTKGYTKEKVFLFKFHV